MTRLLGWTLLSAVLIPVSGASQTSARLGIGAGVTALSGEDFEEARTGHLFGGHAIFQSGTGLEVGVGVDFSNYGVEGMEEDVSQIDAFGVLRYMFPGSALRFFLGGKVGYSRQDADADQDAIEFQGVTVGPTAGLYFPAGPLGLEVGADYMFLSYGDGKLNGEVIKGSEVSGSRIVGRAAVSLPIGG